MNISQRIAVLVAVANLLLLAGFPPFDYVSLQHDNVPTFDGFYFAFGRHPNHVLNMDFLLLEIIVVLINACIAVLLLRAPAASQARRTGRHQGNCRCQPRQISQSKTRYRPARLQQDGAVCQNLPRNDQRSRPNPR